VTLKAGGSLTVNDDVIKGTLRVGSNVEIKQDPKKDAMEAVITKIQDCSQYTVGKLLLLFLLMCKQIGLMLKAHILLTLSFYCALLLLVYYITFFVHVFMPQSMYSCRMHLQRCKQKHLWL
jgi:hypothetical protein